MIIRGGVDPGKQGYITVFFDDKIEFFKMPLIGKEIDLYSFNSIIKTIVDFSSDIYFAIENVHAIFGASSKSTFNFGFGAGGVEGVIISNNVPFTKIPPKKWQKQMWEGVPLQQKSSSTGKTKVTNTKAMSLLAAKRIFPKIDLRDNNRCRKPHDGKVDSLLIAEYCRRNF